MDRHKAIIIVDAEGRSRGYSAEEALARGISNWKGWRCSAGSENLHITADGNAFSATCKVGGWMGNIYDAQLHLPKEWITCSKDRCVCGADMQLRKSRSLDFAPMTYERPPAETTEEPVDPAWVAPYHWEHHKEYPLNITWDLARRCNYHCSYCHPTVSNTFEGHRSWGSLKYAADILLDFFCWEHSPKARKAKWVFTGGEPTINPHYMDLVKYLRERGHLIHTQSNGSRGREYFSELIEYSCVGLSYHFEGANEERFIDTCAGIVEKKMRFPLLWFGVRIMVPPGKAADAVRLRERLMAIEHFERNADIAMSPVYDRMQQEKLMTYEPDELETILKYS